MAALIHQDAETLQRLAKLMWLLAQLDHQARRQVKCFVLHELHLPGDNRCLCKRHVLCPASIANPKGAFDDLLDPDYVRFCNAVKLTAQDGRLS